MSPPSRSSWARDPGSCGTQGRGAKRSAGHRSTRRLGGAASAALLLVACSGPQSALDPAGRDAERLADLFAWMAGGALLVWIAVVALSITAIYRQTDDPYRAGRWLIIGGGVAFPTVVLAVLLGYGLALLPEVLALPPPGGPVVEVTGERFWWRVRYLLPDAEPVTTANEIHLPRGQRIELRLTSPDVIHSFWVPSLGGKMDMIPGRTTRLALEPTRTGVFRGVCAEYCGGAHARMAFHAVVEEPDAFAQWLREQAAPARPPASPQAERGAALFLANGCGACHTVRGTPAAGVLGPDLTHVGGRVGLAAATLPNTPEGFHRWLTRPGEIKPEAAMPHFAMLPPADLAALAAYLEGLQ